MPANKITTRDELIKWALRSIGGGVVEVNLSEEQMNDRVDEALELFYDYHMSGSRKVFLQHEITQEEYDEQKVFLPSDVIDVLRVMPLNDASSINNLQWQSYMQGLASLFTMGGTGCCSGSMTGRGGATSYVIANSYINLLSDIFNTAKPIAFNKYDNYLDIQTPWKNVLEPETIIVVECYIPINPEDHGEAFNDFWLKRYVAALFQQQWGTNLIKFANVSLPGQQQLNGDKILEEGNTKVEALKAELDSRWSLPVDMFLG